MKVKLPSLHTQILIALVAGAIFGAIFNVNSNLLEITYQKENTSVTEQVKNWKSIDFIAETKDPKFSKSFETDNQLEILSHAKRLKKNKIPYQLVVKDFLDPETGKEMNEKTFTDISKVSKETTVSTWIKWIGDIFIRLLNMIAIPLVLSSLIVGAASLGDIKKFARIGSKTIAMYITTTAIAVTIGLTLANLVDPGHQMPEDTKSKLMAVYEDDSAEKITDEIEFSLIDTVVRMVPKNPIEAMSEGDMLPIVFFAVFSGMILTMIRKEKAKPVISFLDGVSETMIKMVDVIMLIAPYGVFALIAATVGEFGFEILETLIWYSLTVLFGLLLQMYGTYTIILKLFTKVKFLAFHKALRKAQTIGFSTSSSAATLPVTMDCCQDNLGVSKSITSFVLPLGATINMDGTAMYQGIAAVFIAQVFGIDLSIGQQLTIVLMATFASIGTAPVPGVGIIMLIIILKSVGIPQQGIALILGVDRILDMLRTMANVTGDAVIAAAIANTENEIDVPEEAKTK